MGDEYKDLVGKVALVSGAGVPGCIGEATAFALASSGASVVIGDIAPSLQDVTDSLSAKGLDVSCQRVDVSEEESIASWVQFALSRYGRIDIVDNNAAATQLTHLDRDVHTMTTELWDQILAVDLRGTMLVCKHTIPEMVKRGGGSIINISSGKALRGDLDEPGYSAAKAGVDSLTRTIATQYGKQGIRCNSVAPGVIQTELMKAVVPVEMAKVILDNVLLPYLGEPRDIADLVVFLASDRSRYITGQTIPVDGGILSQVPVVSDVRRLAPEMQNLLPVDNR